MVVKQLAELYDYKNRLMADLLTDQKIVDLLLDDGETIASPKELTYTRVFPYEFIPETIEHGYTYICTDVDIAKDVAKNISDTFLSATIYIWVFSHKSKLRLPDGGGIRPDCICAEIAEVLNGSKFYGLGELDLTSVRRFAPISDYLGKVMVFHAVDYNRMRPNSKPTPSNRKKW